MASTESTAKTSTNPKRRLGRGLNSLIRQSGPANAAAAQHPAETPSQLRGLTVQELAVEAIQPNPYQPRRDFDPDALAELATSIAQEGVLQPLIVRPDDDGYIVIAGERRLRAARDAGLATVPCIVRNASQQQMIEWAMIENIQRAELNPIERAQAYREYMDRFDLTQAEVAQRLSQPRTTIANHLRILDLHDDIQQFIADGQLSFGHAKVLAALSEDFGRQLQLARQIVGEGLSVRKLEEKLQDSPAGDGKHARGTKGDGKGGQAPQKAAYVRDVEEQLTQRVGTKVAILPSRKKNQGRIVIDYYNLDDFDRVASLLGLDDTDPQ
ncbi:MAG: ParB/RepB/Spo0J family partition protein [Planctomycetes bacterium]|nr:ParB/RepB/Spo0J family partition protein [Phycisphaerae bacterium]NBB95005.1 ParB/RepB/Spo0J family partition protein [Planctomycetota bacterium]